MGYVYEESQEVDTNWLLNRSTMVEVFDVKERDSFFRIDDNDPNSPKRREINFTFNIIDDEAPEELIGFKVYGNTPTTFNSSEKCKLRNWVLAILDVEELELGFELELDDLVGMTCRVRVNKSKKGTIYVTDVLPAEGGMDDEPF